MTNALRWITLIAVLATPLAALTGCGQKGPLFLPEPEQPEQQKQERKR